MGPCQKMGLHAGPWTPRNSSKTNFLGFLKVTSVFAIKRSIELCCQIENRQVRSRAMFDFMGPSAYLCNADVSCRFPLRVVKLLVVYLLYESFLVTPRCYRRVRHKTMLDFYLSRAKTNGRIARKFDFSRRVDHPCPTRSCI